MNNYEKLQAELKRCRQWVRDLQAGMFINCVYCGYRFGPSAEVPASMADVLKVHVEKCPEHPMAKLKADLVELQEAVKWYFECDELFWHFYDHATPVIDGPFEEIYKTTKKADKHLRLLIGL